MDAVERREKLQKQKDALEREISRVDEEIEKSRHTPTEALAIELHGRLCRHNHIDVCDWYYDVKDKVHNWNGWSHSHYLKMATKMTRRCEELGVSLETAAEILNIIKEL